MSEVKPHDCYWPGCGGDTYIMRGSPTRTWVSCKKCDASGPVCERERPAVEAWNSLASCLNSAPKVIKRAAAANIYYDGDGYSVTFHNSLENAKINRDPYFIDTVEVSITFTDSRS